MSLRNLFNLLHCIDLPNVLCCKPNCVLYHYRRDPIPIVSLFCQSVANFLNVPKFQPTIHKSTKQFGFSFAFDAPTVWNSLPEDIRASPTMASFRKKLKTYLYAKAYPP